MFAGQSLADVVRPQSLPATLRVKLADTEHGAAAVRQVVTGQVGVRNVIDQREVVAKLFDTQADCERAKARSTGEGKGEIEGKQVLRIVGRCQELSPEEVQQLRDALQL